MAQSTASRRLPAATRCGAGVVSLSTTGPSASPRHRALLASWFDHLTRVLLHPPPRGRLQMQCPSYCYENSDGAESWGECGTSSAGFRLTYSIAKRSFSAQTRCTCGRHFGRARRSPKITLHWFGYGRAEPRSVASSETSRTRLGQRCGRT